MTFFVPIYDLRTNNFCQKRILFTHQSKLKLKLFSYKLRNMCDNKFPTVVTKPNVCCQCHGVFYNTCSSE